MSIDAKEALTEMTGSGLVGISPNGMPISYAPVGQVAEGATSIDLQVKHNDLQAAFDRNNSGINKRFAKEHDAASKGAKAALSKNGARQTALEGRQAAMLERSGYNPRHPNHGVLTSSASEPTAKKPLNVLQNIRRREFHALRRTLLATPLSRSVAIPASKQQELRRREMALSGYKRIGAGPSVLNNVPVVGKPKVQVAKQKPRQWAMIDPNLIPTGWATH